MIDRRQRTLPAVLLLVFLAACGGGGGGGGGGDDGGNDGTPAGGSAGTPTPSPPTTDPTPPAPPPPPPTSLALMSDAGDYIGGGRSYSYSNADTQITVTVDGARLSVNLNGDENWRGDFSLPSSMTRLEVGVYDNLERHPFHDPAVGGLSWGGEGRGCNRLSGTITINDVVYDGDTLKLIDLSFVQRCENATSALRGELFWNADDPTVPPGPADIPDDLWQPAAGTTPAMGNYIYLESRAGDYIGQGRDYVYTSDNALITVNSPGGNLSVSIDGDERWNANFEVMSSVSFLEVGYYPNLTRYPFNNPVRGGLSWGGEGRGCNELEGWFAVDSVRYDGNTLEAISLRFEQRCERTGPPLYGEIHWDIDNDSNPPGPIVPPPDNLWRPADGVTPDTGNYVYIEGESGDYIVGPNAYTYTQADSVVTLTSNGPSLSIDVNGDQSWSGNFQGMQTLLRLEAGYYGDLQRFPFNNPVKGGLSWSGEGRGCNTLTGWFVVDSVTYDGSTLKAIDLRFEQHCEGGSAAMYGEIHWDVDDDTGVPGPVVPPPDGLWEPAMGTTPASGNYLYLESTAGDYIGGGQTYMYTPADAIFGVTLSGNLLNLDIEGDEDWGARFKGMNSIARLEVGYYGDLQRYPFNNPARGGLSFSGNGRGCNQLDGWFIVDSIVYQGNSLESIELRFEQRCDGGPPLNGELRWDINDPTEAPGPVVPAPPNLWEPTPGIVPATGNYVYLESDAGDYIGAGRNYLYTPLDASFVVTRNAGYMSFEVRGDEDWYGDFRAMNSLSQFEVGYYGDLSRYPFHNPVKGGLSWSGEGRGCNQLDGWFVIDSLSFSGNELTAFELRFEQRCDGGPPLNGAIRWDINDNQQAPGPVVPPPGDLWAPAVGVTPAAGNYVYLESDAGDYIGQGQNYLYTDADNISIDAPGARLEVSVGGWNADFQGMNSLNFIEPGYYGNLERYPFHNAIRGGLNWSGNGRGCNTLTGWFVVDHVTYSGITLTGIDLRFEQHCGGGAPALNGEIHWRQ